MGLAGGVVLARRLRQRLFAAMLARLGTRHEALVADRKRALLGGLRGDVLEIGPGTGVNLAYLDPGVRWIGVEPNPAMDRYLRRAAAASGHAISIRRGRAERLPLPTASVDAVVATLVLCSVEDPAAALAEVRRVLRPGGRFVFLEHVAAPGGTGLRRAQRAVRPVWRILADGCQPDRETGRLIERAGFDAVELEHFRLPQPLVSPHVAGVAVRGRD